MKKIVCVDLDGTIAHFVEWKGESHFGNVIEGTREALIALREKGWLIIIFTTRANKVIIADFLNSNELIFDHINENPFQPENAIGGKPFADVYIDDRAIQFNGDWQKTMSEIDLFFPWEKNKTNFNQRENYGKEFLKHDFDQSYQQLRHYDSLNWDITKFSFAQLLVGITASWALYVYATDMENTNSFIAHSYKWIILSIFGLSYLFSLLASFLISRNRVYYAKVARYLNEHRGFALQTKPLGFMNQTKFYTNITFPPTFDMWSTQIVCLYVILLVSSFMFGAVLYFLSSTIFENILIQYGVGLIGCMTSILFNLCIYISYMKKQDNELGTIQTAKNH
jgi:hypothetical protein